MASNGTCRHDVAVGQRPCPGPACEHEGETERVGERGDGSSLGDVHEYGEVNPSSALRWRLAGQAGQGGTPDKRRGAAVSGARSEGSSTCHSGEGPGLFGQVAAAPQGEGAHGTPERGSAASKTW
jgi:hypothetical protein